ncbi:hypothetical protein A3C21_01870 [Candidatus Kaiserbacteria bacterium RIFCSPHIGHO2_02_FULL_59_21]|uniref:Uncharacterized protein n=1 Tax=Candidatus Kaiserbacteria bacterium RIFCSPHIGHO2_02_FULL_59_21 TaxID=1798500 RepID=A0A1F6DZ68_9BACT|nr:MAG: hypothetical protein A2766_03465 [Candidatus Kaiserbacteria bacterium RIFCSPHIGHO2_01_FULL_58_22]OGG66590.1 MAG: hypothetical protein A3C21_01870 [Candidatus Kaiserbacteria bacterium RIFCSPHIGHO2_02_FULL_59_21]OGG80538.1 MAG: hypothetical protein A2952_01995 [Candidatus Kaiserbacteria bacterium RIFCSPLOWO2_01_FULL_59_34]OGG86260.1 MAG: hypothetical protein A3I47_03560 [Candidatus Kaiserbacteria bacterium RIFCSPLOWO2_02_FULL_59_19]
MRIGLFALGVLGAIFGPPVLPLIAMAVSAIRYPAWEILLLGLLVDFLWLPAFPVSLPLFTIASLALLWGLEPMRREFMAGESGLPGW